MIARDASTGISVMSTFHRIAAFGAVIVALALPTQAQQAGSENVVLAVPNVALTFAPGYLAEDWGCSPSTGSTSRAS